jgi:hypothetical protein
VSHKGIGIDPPLEERLQVGAKGGQGVVVAVGLVKVLNGLGGDGFNGFVNAMHG